MKFRATFFDPETNSATHRIFLGASEADVRAIAAHAGLPVVELKRVMLTVPTLRGRAKIDVSLFCKELQTLLGAGMSLVESIDTLAAREAALGNASGIFSTIQRSLREGKALSGALQSLEPALPVLLVASVRASERTGRVADAFAEYLRYDEAIQALRRRLINAAIYPALVTGFGFLVSVFLLVYVVPRFAKVYEQFAHNLSLPTQILIRIGQLLGQHGIAVICLVGGIGAVVAWLALNGRLFRALLILVRRVGPLRKVVREFQLARVFQTMAMLLRGGYTVLEAIGLSRVLVFDPQLAGGFERTVRCVAEGRSLSSTFAEERITNTVSDRLIQVGERSGDLPRVLDAISEMHSAVVVTFIERATRVVEPVLLMVVGTFIGGIVVLMYMPIFDLANEL